MKGVVSWSDPNAKHSFIGSRGSSLIIPWKNVVNCEPKVLDYLDTITFDVQRDRKGTQYASNIRILTGKEERKALQNLYDSR